jgi:hypothetical protein
MGLFDNEIEMLQNEDQYDKSNELNVKGDNLEFTQEQLRELEDEFPFLKDDPEADLEYIQMLENGDELGLFKEQDYYM